MVMHIAAWRDKKEWCSAWSRLCFSVIMLNLTVTMARNRAVAREMRVWAREMSKCCWGNSIELGKEPYRVGSPSGYWRWSNRMDSSHCSGLFIEQRMNRKVQIPWHFTNQRQSDTIPMSCTAAISVLESGLVNQWSLNRDRAMWFAIMRCSTTADDHSSASRKHQTLIYPAWQYDLNLSPVCSCNVDDIPTSRNFRSPVLIKLRSQYPVWIHLIYDIRRSRCS